MYPFALITLGALTFVASALAVYGLYNRRNLLAALSGVAVVFVGAALIGTIIARYDNTHISKTEACQVVATENINVSIADMSKVDSEYFLVLLDSASKDDGAFGVGDDTFCKNLAELAVRAETVASGDRSSMPGVEGSGK